MLDFTCCLGPSCLIDLGTGLFAIQDVAKQAAGLEAIEADLDDAESCLLAAEAALAKAKDNIGGGCRSNGSKMHKEAAAVEMAGRALLQVLDRLVEIAARAAELLHPRHVVLARAHTLQVCMCARETQLCVYSSLGLCVSFCVCVCVCVDLSLSALHVEICCTDPLLHSSHNSRGLLLLCR
jgi:hypothetical protein